MAVGGFAKSVMGLADEFLQGATKGIGDAGAIKAGVTKLASNKTKGQLKNVKKGVIKGTTQRVKGIQNPTTMNKIGDAVWGGVRDTAASVKGGKTVSEALAMGFKDGDKLKMDRVAGTFVAGSAAARLATGGGLYKDRNGSTNIIGIPFL